MIFFFIFYTYTNHLYTNHLYTMKSFNKINLNKIKLKARSLALNRNTKTIYVPVDDNIYFNGLSFRVRVRRNNNLTSGNFSTIKSAVNFRTKLFK